MTDRRTFLAGATLVPLAGCASVPLSTPGPPGGRFGLDDLARRTFDWFWDLADPRTGLVPDRWPTPSFASIAAVGFALPAYAYGVERGWVSRDAARVRTLTTLRFFAAAPQGDAAVGKTGYRGFFYHFLDMKTGARFETTELSSIDTALLLGGVLFAAEYFAGTDPAETEIRRLAGLLVDRVDWRWMLGAGPFVSMGWHPEKGFIPHAWDSYNEAMLLNLLAIANESHSIDAGLWPRLTARFDRAWGSHWGETHLHFPPLFGHQYSHVWVDFRGIRDEYMRGRGIDYFENSVRATRAQRNYAITNPGGWTGYGGDAWGLTACDGPGDFKARVAGREREFFSYSARGPDERDDGTIAPTAAASSIAFAPALVLPTLAAMHRTYGPAIYGRYGFFDAFNPTLREPAGITLRHGRIVEGLCWVDADYLGIDQGPIIAMIANHRDDFVWSYMRRSATLRRGLERAGFRGGWLER